MSKDPYAGELGNPITHASSYAYGKNNPISFTDPNGASFLDKDIEWPALAYYGLSFAFGSNGVPLIDYGNWCGWKVAPAENGKDPKPVDRIDSQCRKHDLDLLTVAARPSVWEDGYEIPGLNQMVASIDFAIYYVSRIYVDAELAFNMLNHNNWKGKPLMYPADFTRSLAMSIIFFTKAVSQIYLSLFDLGTGGASWIFGSDNGASFRKGFEKMAQTVAKLTNIKVRVRIKIKW